MTINGKEIEVQDIEADGLLGTVSKVHCLSKCVMTEEGPLITTTFSDEEIKEEANKEEYYIAGHNYIPYDSRVIEKLYNVPFNTKIIDTLFLSYALFDYRNLHGLESWGKTFGINKVEVEDSQWAEGDRDLMKLRCETDVKINTNMLHVSLNLLRELYNNEEDIERYINYYNFIARKVRAQEQNENCLILDFDMANSLLEELQDKKDVISKQLEEQMPPVIKYKTMSCPEKTHKKNGEYTAAYENWLELLYERGLPEDYDEEVELVHSTTPPNSSSVPQIKSWLFSLGWEPTTFTINDKKEKVPQIRIDTPEGKELCDSVKALINDNPQVELLSEITILTHRIGILDGANGLLKNADPKTGEIRQGVSSITNTGRYRHTKIVNIPKNKIYGKEIRRCLMAPKGYKLVSGDIKALEDTCKLISVKDIDPEFVAKFSDPNYDAHIDLAVKSGLMTQEQADRYTVLKKKDKDEGLDKTEEKEFKKLQDLRGLGKRGNFSLVYKCGAKKLSQTIKKPIKQCEKIKNTYWEINKAVKIFEDSLLVKTTKDGRMWLKSIISGFWLSLRAEKDKFSLHNQSMGRFLFDNYLGILEKFTTFMPIIDFHDDAVHIIKEDRTGWFKENQKKAIDFVNKKYNLAIPLQVDPAVGDRLDEV